MAQHLIDMDEALLWAARVELGTSTIEDTVNEALRRTADHRASRVASALDVLGQADVEVRTEAWR